MSGIYLREWVICACVCVCVCVRMRVSMRECVRVCVMRYQHFFDLVGIIDLWLEA